MNQDQIKVIQDSIEESKKEIKAKKALMKLVKAEEKAKRGPSKFYRYYMKTIEVTTSPFAKLYEYSQRDLDAKDTDDTLHHAHVLLSEILANKVDSPEHDKADEYTKQCVEMNFKLDDIFRQAENEESTQYIGGLIDTFDDIINRIRTSPKTKFEGDLHVIDGILTSSSDNNRGSDDLRQAPAKVKKLVIKYGLISDILAFVGVYIILGGTLTALIASAIMGIFISALLAIAKNPNDYMYIYDFKQFVKEKAHQAKVALNDYGKMYRNQKLAQDNS